VLFGLFDGHLARRGYIARGGQILDASIVPVLRTHNTRNENAAVKKGEVPAHSTEDGHRFHGIVGTCSTASWAALPREGGRLV
jgi:hypothetical protein